MYMWSRVTTGNCHSIEHKVSRIYSQSLFVLYFCCHRSHSTFARIWHIDKNTKCETTSVCVCVCVGRTKKKLKNFYAYTRTIPFCARIYIFLRSLCAARKKRFLFYKKYMYTTYMDISGLN